MRFSLSRLTLKTNVHRSQGLGESQRCDTRGDISHTVWDVCCEPLMPFHIHQSTRSPKLTTERHSATLKCVLAQDPWVCREASELPLVAPVNAEPHKTYVSSLLLLWRLFRDSTARDLLRRQRPSQRPTSPHAAHMVFHCLHLSKDPNWSSCVLPETHLATRDWRHPCRSPPCSPCFLHIKNLLAVLLDLFFIRVRPEDSQKNSSICAIIVHSPSASLGPLSPSPRLQSRDRKPRVHDSTALVISLLEATLHIANIQKLLKNKRWLSFCRASNSKCGLLKHVMSEVIFFAKSRFAVF